MLSVARCILAAGVSAQSLTSAARSAANAAFKSISASDFQEEHFAADAAAYAVQTAFALRASDGARAARAAAFATQAAYAASSAVTDLADSVQSAISKDTEVSFPELLVAPIWHETREPEALIANLMQFPNLMEDSAAWDFWREWYRGFLIGKPLNWRLQQLILTDVSQTAWEAGPEAVAEEIDRIRAAYLVEKAPQAERVEFNPETAKFYTVPLEVTKPDLLGATLNQVQDALEDVLASPSNGLHDAAREVRVLRRVFNKYGNDPQQIEMGFVSVHKGLTRQILNDELPQSEENLALQDALEEGARAIRATHPDVAENRKILSNQAIRELPKGAKDALTEALPILVAISEPDLAEDWEHDIPQLINDATLPLPSGAPPLPGADEATRIFSRVAKIALHMKAAEVVHKIDGSTGYKAASIVLTIASLVTLGLAIIV